MTDTVRLTAERNQWRERATRAEAEAARLRLLVGDETAGGDTWRGCDRAEAIRQADHFHAETLRWMREHDKRRDERDEARETRARRIEETQQ